MPVKIDKEEFIRRIYFAIYALLTSFQGEMEQYMKDNAPWKDRTGTARTHLNVSTLIEVDKMKIRLSHGVEYGVYLEYAHGAKYAILRPTADLYKDKIKEEIKALFRR